MSRLLLAISAGPLLAVAVHAGEATLSPGRTFAEQGGAALYANVCAACHQSDAKGASGAGSVPGLAGGSELGSSGFVLRVVLDGLDGMPPVGGMMNDEQVADVVNYVRSHFGNAYPDRVSPADVKAARRSP